jgi:L,D-transpeptidase YnhG
VLIHFNLRALASRVAALACAATLAIGCGAVQAKEHAKKPGSRGKNAAVAPLSADGLAEARLMEIYKLTGQGRTREAMQRAQALVRDYPHFQLAQLVYGDMLTARKRPMRGPGELASVSPDATQTLTELREESLLRLQALRERPPAGHVPSQFVQLSARNKHAIAIDTSRARLYLFENGTEGLKLLADYYISVGKQGAGKSLEGDMRTPLGVYFVTSQIDPKKLKDFYGAGALPINYPNPYDSRHGKTGSGIWLHGTPPGQFARAPRTSDGCVVLANPDLQRLMRTVESRTTPVVIAKSLNWVAPSQLMVPEVKAFAEALSAWREAKSRGDAPRLLSFYTADMALDGKGNPDGPASVGAEPDRGLGREFEFKDLSYLRWTDSSDTMVVTFGEVVRGSRTGPVKRQYWVRTGRQWKIFFEGVIG